MTKGSPAGGAMGKIVGAQSLVIACAVAGRPDHEGAIFTAVLEHGIALMAPVGIMVMLCACVFPGAIPNGRQCW
jgi:L-lactate permease